MKLTKMVYIASPFSAEAGPYKELVEHSRYTEITSIAAYLTKKYKYAFILPITQSYQLKNTIPSLGGSFKDWERIDLTFVSRCDEVWVIKMKKWNKSVGVRAEIEFAKRNGIPVKYFSTRHQRFVKG